MPQSTVKQPIAKKSSTLPIVFLILTIGILGAGGYVVYQTMNGKGTLPGLPGGNVASVLTGNNSLMKISEADFADVSDPLIRKHLAKQYSTTKFKIMSSSDGRGSGGQSVVSVDYRSDKDVRMQMVQVDENKESLNMITIGDTRYLKDQTDGKWWMEKDKPNPSVSPKETPADTFTPEKWKEEAAKEAKATYNKLGEESCGSAAPTLTCYKYEEVQGTADSGKRTFWFDKKDLLLRKEQNGYGEYTSESTYTYDNINVSAPSPTKPVPEGKGIYEMMFSGMMPTTNTGSSNADSGNGMPSAAEQEQMMNQLKPCKPNKVSRITPHQPRIPLLMM